MYRQNMLGRFLSVALFGLATASHDHVVHLVDQERLGARGCRGKVRGVPHGRGTAKPKHHSRRNGRGARRKRRRSRLRGGRG